MTEPNAPSPRLSLRRPAALIATGFGAGLLPKAPGTWGSLVALPLAWLVHEAAGTVGGVVAVAIVVVVGLWATGAVLNGPDDDPGHVVVDEIAGQWLTLLAVPADPVLYAIGFVLFRIADIAKPWPVCLADRQVKGALGVMLDDLLAAVYAGGALYLIAETWRT